VVGIPQKRATEVTTNAGGWFHLQNAFEPDRFDRAVSKNGAASFSVGMPNFVSLYALNASLRYLDGVGVVNIAGHADPLVHQMQAGLRELGLRPMAAQREGCSSGILAFFHEDTESIHAAMEKEEVHIMHHAGRLRMALHGYNAKEDVEKFLGVLKKALN
jgi:selenocysteine lyase/cysteine desulfurase